MMDYIFRKLAEKAVDTAVDMAADAIKSKRCTQCGQAMGHDARFCPHCGWDQQVTPPGQRTPSAPPKSGKPALPQTPSGSVVSSATRPPPSPPESSGGKPPPPGASSFTAFQMRIEAVYSIKGRTVVAGPVERGAIHAGDRVEAVGGGQRRATTALSVESVSQSLESARPGDNVAVCIKDLRSDEVLVGMLLASPGAVDASVPIVVRAQTPAHIVSAPRPPAGAPQAPEQAMRIFEGHRDPVAAVALSSDGKLALSADTGGAVHVWDLAAGSLNAVLQASDARGGKLWLASVAFSPDNRLALAGAVTPPYPLLILDLSTGGVTQRLAGHSDAVNVACWLPDGRRLLSCSQDGTLRLWDAGGGRELRRFEHPSEVSGMAVSADGRQALSLCGDSTLRLWDIAGGDLLAQISVGSDYASPLSQKVSFSPDGTRAATCNLVGDVELWQLPGGQRVAALAAAGNAFDVAFAPDGRRVAAASGSDYVGPEISDNHIHVWELASGAESMLLKGHTGNVNCIAIARDGRSLFSGSADKTVRLWAI